MLKRAQAQIITFPALDIALPPARKSGLTFSAGNSKLSKDGGLFVNTANLPTELGTTGRYSLQLTAAELDAVWVHLSIENAAIIPYDQFGSTSGHLSGAVQTGSNTASSFATTLTSAVTNTWKDSLLLFTTGSLAGQVKKVTAYDGTTRAVTLASAFTGVPSVGDLFLMIDI